jgi:hypothetical protein
MNILILPGAETVLSNQEIDWIQKTIPGNEKVLVDAIDFAVNHPETYVGILIGRYEDSFDYTPFIRFMSLIAISWLGPVTMHI